MLRRTLAQLAGRLASRGYAAANPAGSLLAPAASRLNPAEREFYNRQRSLMNLENRFPVVAPDTFVAPSAILVGDVDVYDRASIWYGAVLRGDLNAIRVGPYSSVGDRCVIHAARSSPTGMSAATILGAYVTIGPGSVLRSCQIEDEAIVGERSILMEGSLVETHSILAPGSVLPPGRRIPEGQLWGGNPARFIRLLTKDEKEEIAGVAEGFYKVANEHLDEFYLPFSSAYIEAEALRARVAARAAKAAEAASAAETA